MRIPLDTICVRSGVLCPRCKRLVDSGVYTNLEVDIMKALLELEEDPNYRFLKNAAYVKSYETNSMVIVIIDFADEVPQPLVIRVSRALSDRLNMKIRIIKFSQDQKAMVAQLFAPARIRGIDSVWLPDGDVQHIIRISKFDAKHLPLTINELENLLSKIFNNSYRIKIT